ncbi:ROK family protein [Streptomyces sp. NPDC004609]|uniref:ROK family protein n=1 Tax=Streptomyces sp. NPDC004609 TaxID=3364704 RepID=UPI0036737FF4
MYAGMAIGRTQVRCAIGTGPEDVRHSAEFPVTSPDETLDRVTRHLAAQQERFGAITALGLSCFGPLGLRPGGADHGRVTSTLMTDWQGYDLVGAVRRTLAVPVVLDTDVNSAAVAEWSVGAGRGRGSVTYLTVGTGLGAGAVVGGRPVHGRAHPEMGHLPVARHPSDEVVSRCRHHHDCLEGLAKSGAIAARLGLPPSPPGADPVRLPEEAVRLEAWYLAQLTTALTYLLSPERIVVAGAVMAVAGMLPALREATALRLGDDPGVAAVVASLDDYLVPSPLGGRAELLGTLVLAAYAPRTAAGTAPAADAAPADTASGDPAPAEGTPAASASAGPAPTGRPSAGPPLNG